MATGFKSGGKNIKPGQVLNPRGNGGHQKELTAARKLTEKQFLTSVTKWLDTPLPELKIKFKDPKTKAIDCVVLSVIIKSIEHGDHTRLNFLLDRTIGKVVEKKQIETNGHLSLMNLMKQLENDDERD